MLLGGAMSLLQTGNQNGRANQIDDTPMLEYSLECGHQG